jgi:arginase
VTTTLLLPYHQDERLPDGGIELPAGVDSEVVDPALPGAGTWERMAALYRALADAVSARQRPTVVVGDCCALLGTLAGVQRSGVRPALVWFDAHGDLHTLGSSLSGYLGGMPLRWALGGDFDSLAGPVGVHPLREEQVALVDARDLDPPEVSYLATSAIHHLQVSDVDGSVLGGDAPLVVHIDVDVIDAAEVPGVRYPAAGGPSADAVVAALDRLMASGRVVALSISCGWHPPADASMADARTALLARLLR